MGPQLYSSMQTRASQGKTCADAGHDEYRVPQGPTGNEDHLFSHPQTNLPDVTSEECHRLSVSPTANHPDDITRGVDVIANTDSLSYPEGDHSKEGRDRLEMHVTGEWPTSKDSDALGKVNPPVEREDAALPKQEVVPVRGTLEGRWDAHSQETLKLNEEFKAVIQRWEHDLQEQERLVLETRGEVSVLQDENRNLRERNTELSSPAAQVVELQEIVCKFREVLENEAFRDKVGLLEDLRKCRIELASASQGIDAKSHNIEELKEANLVLEAANSKLEQKSEQIQQELCKERLGQHGSYVDGQQTPSLLESTAKDMFSAIAVFSSSLSKYKDRNGFYPVHATIVQSDLFKRVRVARERHWTYLLREYICSRLFRNFHSETFPRPGSEVLYLDEEERKRKCFDYFKSCKDEGAWDRAVSQASNDNFDDLFVEYFTSICKLLLPWDVQYQLRDVTLVGACLRKRLSSLLPDMRFLVEGLIVAAGKVWQFHKLCLSFEPPATMFSVSNGDLFNQGYMESIDAPENDDGSTVPKVEFMTYPGFRLRKSIIKCQVYIAIDT